MYDFRTSFRLYQSFKFMYVIDFDIVFYSFLFHSEFLIQDNQFIYGYNIRMTTYISEVHEKENLLLIEFLSLSK